jgi:lysophospholipase-3
MANMVLSFNSTTHEYSYPQGVDMNTAVDWGGVDGVSWLYWVHLGDFKYFADVVDAFVAENYTIGLNIRAAPYDWRLAPDGLNQTGFFANLSQLVVDTYQKNGQTKVAIVAHSLGTMLTRHWLLHESPDFIAQYVDTFVAISPPFAGAVATIMGIISGYTFDIPLPHDWFRPTLLASPSIVYLTPLDLVFGDRVLVSTNNVTYNSSQILDMLQGVDAKQAQEYWTFLADMRYDGTPMPSRQVPYFIYCLLAFHHALTYSCSVQLHCIYGYDVQTFDSLHYDVAKLDPYMPAPTVRWGDGDGTVHILIYSSPYFVEVGCAGQSNQPGCLLPAARSSDDNNQGRWSSRDIVQQRWNSSCC